MISQIRHLKHSNQGKIRWTGHHQNHELLCVSKDTVKKMKRPLTMGENICNHVSGKGLVSIIYKELPQLNNRRPPKDIQMVDKHMTRYSASLVIREMRVKTLTRHHFTPTSMSTIKKTGNSKCWWGRGEIKTYTAGGNVKWYSHFQKKLGSSSKT